MLTMPAGYFNAIQQTNRTMDVYVVINGTTYTSDQITELYFSHGVISDVYSVGDTPSAYLRCQITGIPRATALDTKKIEPYIGVEVSGVLTYLKVGVFYIEETERDMDLTTVHAMDKMVQLETEYVPSGSISTYPALISSVLADVLIGQSYSITLPSYLTSYTVPKLEKRTKRQMLGFIAALCGGFAYVDRSTEQFKIKVPSNSPSSASVQTITGDTYFTYTAEDNQITISGVNLTDGTTTWTGGTSSGFVLDVYSPMAKSTIATNVYNQISATPMISFESEYTGNPALEIGDSITFTEYFDETTEITKYLNVGAIELTYRTGLIGTLKNSGEGKTKNSYQTNGNYLSAIQVAQNTANNAFTSANGKNTVYYQTTAPAGTDFNVGDTWFDTDDGNRIYEWDGSAWAAVQFGTNAIANLAITNALIATGTIQYAKIGSVDAGTISVGQINADRIGANTITTNKLAVINPNLVSDVDSFEQFNGIEPYGAKGSLSTCIVTDEQTYHGLYSLKTISSAVNSYKYLADQKLKLNNSNGWIKLNAGKRYILSCFVKTTSATATGAQLVLNTREGKTSTALEAFTASDTVAAADGWKRIYVVTTALTGTSPFGIFYVRNVASGTTLYWDAIQVEELSSTNTTTPIQPSPFTPGGQGTINASNITAGTISADYIKGGQLTVGGVSNQWSTFEVLDQLGLTQFFIDNSMIQITNRDGFAIFDVLNLNSYGSQVGTIKIMNLQTDYSAKLYSEGYDGTTYLTPTLELYTSPNNGSYAGIKFSDNYTDNYLQWGMLRYTHVDGQSYGSGNAFIFEGNQSSAAGGLSIVMKDTKLIPQVDNTGVVGNASYTWANGNFNLLTVGTLTANNLLPATDNIGTVGSAALTWNSGQFTDFTVNNLLTTNAMAITTTSVIANLNADRVDSLHASDFFRGNISIGSGADLNTLTTVGTYYCATTAVAQTVTNNPFSTGTSSSMMAFSLTVERHAAYKQTLSFYATTNYSTWIRNQYSGTWGTWRQIVTDDGIPDLSAYSNASINIGTGITTTSSVIQIGNGWGNINVSGGNATQTSYLQVQSDGLVYVQTLKNHAQGTASIIPSAANTPTALSVTFPTGRFDGTPSVVVSARTSVPGTQVTGIGVLSESTASCTIWLTRTNTASTGVAWIASKL